MKPKIKRNPESVVREIKRNTRRKFNPDKKIRIVLKGLKGEDSYITLTFCLQYFFKKSLCWISFDPLVINCFIKNSMNNTVCRFNSCRRTFFEKALQ